MFQELHHNQQACGRKRARTSGLETGDELRAPYPSDANTTLRVVGHWMGAQFPLTLSAPVLDADGNLNTTQLPGLFFFYAPRVEFVEYPLVHLRLSSEGTPCDAALQRERRSCPIHGPFSCSCPVMHQAATMLQALLRELCFPSAKSLDVAVDEHPSAPHVYIDTRSHTWSLFLVGLPVPERLFGPMPLAQFDYPFAIRQNLNRFAVKLLNEVPNPCAHCGAATNHRCTACNCLICDRCVQACGGCQGRVCHACSDYTDDGGLVCHWCRS